MSSPDSLLSVSQDSVPAVAIPATIGEVVTNPLEIKTVGIEWHKKTAWVFIIIAIIVIVILFLIARSAQDWFASLNNTWSWLKAGNMTAIVIIMVIVILLMAYVSYIGFVSAMCHKVRSAIAWLFGATMVLLIVWFVVFYRGQNLNAAAWISIVVLIVGIAQTYFVWKANYRAGWGMIPYLLWLITAVVFGWHLKNENLLE